MSEKDLNIMAFRRGGAKHESFDGLSIGKLAGTLIFRLSRYRIVHVSGIAMNRLAKPTQRLASKLQEVAAFRFVCQDILKIHPPKSHPELLYLLSRRHINQEMIGLAMDVFSEHCKRLVVTTPLDSAPFNQFYKHQ
ncbi:MAG: hypothetical protein HQL39_10885 [Alphaproteobacteria bacterium]|nr:hypothetical protein [Alphaproteobacteria bacterium]